MGLNSFGLDAFYICAQEKNFTRASRRLNITQSALSQRIKNLEQEIGSTLFIRDRLGVRLTEPGEVLLRYCHTRTQLEQELLGQVSPTQTELSGRLRVGGFASVMRSVVLPSCQALSKKNPKVHISLITKEMFNIEDLLRNSTVDFILLDTAVERKGIKSILLGHEINIRVRKKGTEFNGYFLDHDERDVITLRYFKQKIGSKIQRHYMGDIYGIIDGVRQGLGDAVLPKHLMEDIKGLDVIDEKQTLRIPVYLNYNDSSVPTQLFKVFTADLIKTAKEILS